MITIINSMLQKKRARLATGPCTNAELTISCSLVCLFARLILRLPVHDCVPGFPLVPGTRNYLLHCLHSAETYLFFCVGQQIPDFWKFVPDLNVSYDQFKGNRFKCRARNSILQTAYF